MKEGFDSPNGCNFYYCRYGKTIYKASCNASNGSVTEGVESQGVSASLFSARLFTNKTVNQMGKQEKRMYEHSREAQYLFETYNFDGTFTRWRTAVEVLGETVKSYLIKLKEPIRNHFVGDQIWVMKKKVRFPRVPLDTSHYWFNNFESRELNFENVE